MLILKRTATRLQPIPPLLYILTFPPRLLPCLLSASRSQPLWLLAQPQLRLNESLLHFPDRHLTPPDLLFHMLLPQRHIWLAGHRFLFPPILIPITPTDPHIQSPQKPRQRPEFH